MKQMKRFYKEVSVAEQDGGHVVLLDNKPLKTLQGAMLRVPSRGLAEAIAEEWRGQGEHLDRNSMMLTGIANGAVDRAGTERGQVIEQILGFGRSDLICYRASEPEALKARQAALWDPLLDWARTKHGLRLMADAGISYIEQPIDAIVRMQELVSGLDDFTLAPFELASALTGSFVIGLALVEGHILAEQAFSAALADEIFQAEKWGDDAEAAARRARLRAELDAVARFVRLLTV
ncbi:MAG TPA: ATP12 family protein [Rhizomicrobium sp.]|jgi:chaperone required for assembly of F1-ATPase